MSLYLSDVKVTHDPSGSPTVLVAIGDYLLDEWPSFEGAQQVRLANIIDADSPARASRKNSSHTFTFRLAAKKAGGATAAVSEALGHSAAIPLGVATVQFENADGDQWNLANAIVESWDGRQRGDIAERSITISGGTLTAVP